LTIFHLKIELRKKDYGCLYKQGNFFSEVYPSLEMAVEEGVKIIGKMIELLRDEDNFYRNEPVGLFVKEQLYYNFDASEFDPETRDIQRKRPCKELKAPTKIVWEYDCEGKLIDCIEWWDAGYLRLPGDELDDAGRRFQVGDFVTADKDDSKIYIVVARPHRPEDAASTRWENIYRVLYITEDGYFGEECHEHFHESKLCLYTEKVPENSALRLISDIMTGRKKISDDVRQKLFAGEISLSDKPNWRSIDELSY
jgi:hypothetical protein